MAKYLSIGKVSKLKNVSIKSLRYYDDIGVFRPAYINQSTNYRYYTEEQLPMLDAISTCIELGIPLKSLENYVSNNGFAFQALLADCKQLAENRIRSIYNSLERLKTASEHVSDAILVSESQMSSKSKGNTKSISERTVLTLPLEESDNISQKILRLLMLAQLLGIEASYPSGIIHDYSGDYRKHLFITVLDTHGSLDNRIITIPGGVYCYNEIKEHIKGNPLEQLKLSIKPNSYIIEADILEDEKKKKGLLHEIEYLPNGN